jgi:hypothetical protein
LNPITVAKSGPGQMPSNPGKSVTSLYFLEAYVCSSS